MASIQRHGKGWRVQLYVDGRRRSQVFPTKQEASSWALQAEAELAGRTLPAVTLADALNRYNREVKRAGVADLHFHDSRSEAIWRLSKKLDALQLAKMIGHRDINSLLFYYRESAEEMARKLG